MENNIISVEQTIQNIKEGLSQRGASSKDENIVMRAMLNDPNFKADIYGKDGVIGQICPHDEATKFTASVVSKTASIPQAEAELLAEKHKMSYIRSRLYPFHQKRLGGGNYIYYFENLFVPPHFEDWIKLILGLTEEQGE